jgi:hypothetical protein
MGWNAKLIFPIRGCGLTICFSLKTKKKVLIIKPQNRRKLFLVEKENVYPLFVKRIEEMMTVIHK